MIGHRGYPDIYDKHYQNDEVKSRPGKPGNHFLPELDGSELPEIERVADESKVFQRLVIVEKRARMVNQSDPQSEQRNNQEVPSHVLIFRRTQISAGQKKQQHSQQMRASAVLEFDSAKIKSYSTNEIGESEDWIRVHRIGFFKTHIEADEYGEDDARNGDSWRFSAPQHHQGEQQVKEHFYRKRPSPAVNSETEHGREKPLNEEQVIYEYPRVLRDGEIPKESEVNQSGESVCRVDLGESFQVIGRKFAGP